MHKKTTRAKRVLLALDWYDHRLHRGVARVAAARGWLLDCPTLAPGWQAVPTGWLGDGAICLLNAVDDWRRLKRACSQVVDIGLTSGRIAARTVVDNAAIARLAYDHLRSRGFRSLAVHGLAHGEMLNERARTFAGLAAADGVPCVPLSASPLRHRRQPRLGEALLALPRPTAVFAAQDYLGAEVIRAALAAGLRIPDDLAVLGSDDQELTCLALPVPMASIDSDQEGLGTAAAVRLARMLDGHADDHRLQRWPPKGVTVRASVETLGTVHPGIRAALLMMERDPACGVAALARAADLSPQGLAKACQRELGIDPGRLLRRARLAAAQRALAGGADLHQAAKAAGIPSAGALCGLFRREVGISPGRWRKGH